jgi:hypothetical protein
MLFYKLNTVLQSHKVSYAIAGGWAVSLYGAVRGTVDIDIVLLLNLENLKRAVKALESIGLESRLPVTPQDLIDFRMEYIKNRKMLAWRFTNAKDRSEVVDILIVEDLKGLKTEVIKMGKQKVPLVAKADLIRMKKAAGRPQDLEDVRALEAIKK